MRPHTGRADAATPAPIRVGVALLLASQVAMSGWQLVFPRHFYDTFPTVALVPPFNEHLMRDFGAAGLGIAVVLAAAVAWPIVRLTLIALAAYLVYAVPHLLFHVSHLEHHSSSDVAFVLASVGGSVAAPAVLMVATIAARVRKVDAAARE